MSGNASWYNNWAWLTDNSANQVGGIYLNKKIQLDTDFSVTGTLATTLNYSGTNGDGSELPFTLMM